MDGGGEGGYLFLYPFQLFSVEDGGGCGHAVPETSVPSSLMLLGQLDPGLHDDGGAGWCSVIGDVFLKDVELAGVVFFMVVVVECVVVVVVEEVVEVVLGVEGVWVMLG